MAQSGRFAPSEKSRYLREVPEAGYARVTRCLRDRRPMSDLADRVQRVRLLLDTLDDPYPQPSTALRPDSGPAASAYVPCETCRRAGEVRVRGGWQLCLLCDGRGWRRRQAGDPEWDAYVELPVVEAAALPVPIAP